MANSEKWTLKDFADDLDKTISGWKAQLAGMTSTKQVEAAKNTQNVAKAVIEELGKSLTAGGCSNQEIKRKHVFFWS